MPVIVRPEPDLLTTHEAATYLGCDRHTIRRRAAAGLRPAYRGWGEGRATLYRRADLDRLRPVGMCPAIPPPVSAQAGQVVDIAAVRGAVVALHWAVDQLLRALDPPSAYQAAG